MKGFKDSKKKFHPITKTKSIRKKRSPSTMQGVKIRRARDKNSQIKNISKDVIININRKVVIEPSVVKLSEIEPFWVRDNEMNEVMDNVDDAGRTKNKKENVLQKATHLMASISQIQPFVSGNKRTAVISTSKFLEDNGYDFSIKTERDRDELILLLNEIQGSRSELDPEVLQKIYFYITNRIKKHG